MNGNTPYAGLPSVTPAGKRAQSDLPELSSEQKHRLRQDVSAIAAETRTYLPNEYAVDVDVDVGASGPQAMIAVQPPIGRPVSAGFTPAQEDLNSDTDPIVDEEHRQEVARGLAASAALQVKQAISGNVPSTAR
ncbi:MAG: DUF5811 family protein [Salinarchaeum sp.]